MSQIYNAINIAGALMQFLNEERHIRRSVSIVSKQESVNGWYFVLMCSLLKTTVLKIYTFPNELFLSYVLIQSN